MSETAVKRICAKCHLTVGAVAVSTSSNPNEVYHEECFPYPQTEPNAETVKLRECPLCGKDASEVRCHPSGQRMVQCSDFPQNCILSRFIVPLHQWQRRHDSHELKRLRDALETIARQPGPRIPSLSFNMLQDIARGALGDTK